MPAEVLYRKWRPQRFADVAGQDAVTRTLQNALARGTVSHAYLFSGPRGTGKTTFGQPTMLVIPGRALGAAIAAYRLSVTA